MSTKSYSQEQIEFLESLMEMLTLSGYKPKMKEDYPAIQITLKEMNGTKLLIFANPENFTSFSGMSFSNKLEVRYKNVLDVYECMIHFTGDLELVEGWETLVKYDEFVEHQQEGGLNRAFHDGRDGLLEPYVRFYPSFSAGRTIISDDVISRIRQRRKETVTL